MTCWLLGHYKYFIFIIVLDEVAAPPLPPQRGTPPVFGSCLFWPNAWMDEDTTWYGSGLRPRPHCVRRGPSSPVRGAQQPPSSFRPMSIVATVAHLSYC